MMYSIIEENDYSSLGNDIQAFADLLDDVLAARSRARSLIGSLISEEDSATFIDVGLAYGGSEFVTDGIEHDQDIDGGYAPLKSVMVDLRKLPVLIIRWFGLLG
nr:E3 ubiquitin-protein ligase UPL1-like [Tanacetum cinerariifolium]